MKEKTKILVPLDGSELAEDALGEALILGKALKAEVTFLHVIPIPEDVIGQVQRAFRSMSNGRPEDN